jgi:NAD(P)-dependent dehydrogenase (short-subunit alcohol dehydrogenase family)
MGVYAATKWGIEGFFEGTIPEIAPFGIEVPLVEPGASRTNFAGSSADGGQILDVYDQTPVGDFRRLVAALPCFRATRARWHRRSSLRQIRARRRGGSRSVATPMLSSMPL